MPAKHSLTEGSIPRALVAFALPILFGNVLQSVNGSVNAIWVGKFLGEAALAAVGNSNVVMFVMFGASFVLYGVVRATGAVMAPLIMLIISLWVVRVPFAFSMLDRWHADAIWWSFPIASIISVTLSSSYYRFGGWRKVRLGVAEIRTAPGASLSSTALSSTARSSGALGSGAGSAAGGSAAALAGRAAANTTPSS